MTAIVTQKSSKLYICFAIALMVLACHKQAHSSTSCTELLSHEYFTQHPTQPDLFLLSNTSPPQPSPVVISEVETQKILRKASPAQKPYLLYLFSKLRESRVSFGELRKALDNSVKLFVDQNPALISAGNFIIFSESSFWGKSHESRKKSNQWVAELAMETAPQNGLPKAVWNKIGRAEDFIAELNQSPTQTDIVMFDDASYSGSQLASTLLEMGIFNTKDKLNIHILIPYMSDKAKKRALEVMKGSPKLRIKLYTSRTLKRFTQQIEEDAAQGLCPPDTLERIESFVNLDNGEYYNYFDHKIPDRLSFLSSPFTFKLTSALVHDFVLPQREYERFQLITPFSPPYYSRESKRK